MAKPRLLLRTETQPLGMAARRCLQTVEDLYTQSFVLPYLVPMLENAGANVLLPRERDCQTAEIIIDNDGCLNTNSTYTEHTADKVWRQGTGKGFAHLRPQYIDFENPFKEGTFRIAETVKKEKKARPNGFPKYLKTDNMQSMYPIRLFQTAVTTPFIPFIIKAGYPNSKSTRKWGRHLGLSGNFRF